MQHHSIRVGDIEIGERHRALSDDAVARLAASLKDIGLRQPISVRIVEEMIVAGELTAGVPVLVAGAHRLAAAKSLGWSHIDCVEIDDDAIKAEMWEIAENLHRLDLTKEQRDEHIRRYIELLKAKRESDATIVVQSGQQLDRPVGRPKSIVTEVSDATGLSRQTIARAQNPKPVSSDPPKEVYDVHEMARRRMVSAWNAATEQDRQWFRDWIDTPIMDQRYG